MAKTKHCNLHTWNARILAGAAVGSCCRTGAAKPQHAELRLGSEQKHRGQKGTYEGRSKSFGSQGPLFVVCV